MSNRTLEQVSEIARYKASHLAQMDALLREGLTDAERVDLFADAAFEAIKDFVPLLSTAPSSLSAEETCPSHVASKHDPKLCARCGTHIDSLRPDDGENWK